MNMIPRVSGVYRFPTGIRVVLSEPCDGKVKVAQPQIRFTPLGDTVRLKDDGSVFAYPGVAYLEVNSINRRYDLAVIDEEDEAWALMSTTILKTPVKRKRKPRKKK